MADAIVGGGRDYDGDGNGEGGCRRLPVADGAGGAAAVVVVVVRGNAVLDAAVPARP
jgi:hypothetical protein